MKEINPLKAVQWPKLQVALDLKDLKEALRIAEAAYRGGAEWLEAGTPLIKSVGMKAVRQLKKKFPAATVVADLKTLDTGWMETEMAARAGADVVSISGLAHNNTVKDAVRCAQKYGVKIMVDLLEVEDSYERAKELENLGAEYICLHSGIDAQRDAIEEINRKLAIINRVVRSVKVPVAVGGGIQPDTAAKVVKVGAKIVIVGRAITGAEDPEAATLTIRMFMAKAR